MVLRILCLIPFYQLRMNSVIRIKTNYFVVSSFVNNMNTKTFCHLIMINLHFLITVIIVWLSCKGMINLVNCHV